MLLSDLIIQKASLETIKDFLRFLKTANKNEIADALQDAAYYRRWGIVPYLCELMTLNQSEFWSVAITASEAASFNDEATRFHLYRDNTRLAGDSKNHHPKIRPCLRSYSSCSSSLLWRLSVIKSSANL